LSSGAGRLSVSMAVKNSTLKKRIKTMKYHKLHKASFRQSIAFLLLMIVGITLPIACSDLRGPDTLSLEELENTQLNIQESVLTINGIQLNDKALKDISVGGLGAVSIMAGEYGMFKVAPRQFEGGINAGIIDGNVISFKINELNVELRSSSNILDGSSNSSLWVSHNKEIAGKIKQFSPALLSNENAEAIMPPPPPTPPSFEEQEDLGDYFVVVEEMPKLIGGMKAIQSKIEYPTMAQQAGIEGKVTVQFIVNENGDVENAQVVRGIGGGADEEALRVVKDAKFEPGVQRGQKVRVLYAMSINFRLEDANYSAEEPSN